MVALLCPGCYTIEMMRPLLHESLEDTSLRILAILEEVLVQVHTGGGGIEGSEVQVLAVPSLPPVLDCLSSPAMYAPTKTTKHNHMHIRRSLAHSDADVAELSNRQSARSALGKWWWW